MKNYIRIISMALALTVASGCGITNGSAKNVVSSTKTVDMGKNVENRALSGFSVCIDPGHGKSSKANTATEPIAPGSAIQKAAIASGTQGVVTGISEESLNLTVSKKLRKSLEQNGAKVVMVRETNACNMTNVERAKFWNSSGVNLTIRIHGNGTSDSSVSGILMMVPGNKYVKDPVILKKSRKAGELILQGVLEKTKAKSRGLVETSEMTGFNWSKVPVILLEMGFMTNPGEDRLLNSDEYQDKMVAGITEGLIKYVKEK
ncbi:MAG TPA: N-acetylmuramoyl-L-alanine amidase [Ruminiclostridium sp.]|nr:N-acetylmuramoyl-L-alanine amidase [Ruminiclostridium sp.]